MEPGDLFGEFSLVGEREPVQVEVFEDTLICALHRGDFIALLRNQPESMLRVMKVLAERLRQAEDEIADLVCRTVPGRVASVLLRLAEAYGERDGRSLHLMLRITHHDIASMIGETRETVTSTLSGFRDDGLIDVDQRHIIHHPPRSRGVPPNLSKRVVVNAGLLTALGLAGTAISAYVWYKQVTSGRVLCIGRGCAIVIRSPYGRLLGIPNGKLGVVYFLLMSLVPWLRPAFPELHGGAALVTSVALALYLYLTYLQFFVLRALCSWCLTSAALTVGIFMLLVVPP